jgi:hypothetical protein
MWAVLKRSLLSCTTMPNAPTELYRLPLRDVRAVRVNEHWPVLAAICGMLRQLRAALRQPAEELLLQQPLGEAHVRRPLAGFCAAEA